jgi:hypothetical protein
MFPLRNKVPPLSKIWLPLSRLFVYNFGLLFSFWLYVPFEVIIGTNFHTGHTELPEHKKY